MEAESVPVESSPRFGIRVPKRVPKRSRRGQSGRRPAVAAEAEFPPREFDETKLRDAINHEAAELERELRDNRLTAAGERLEAALLKRLEQPSTWEIVHRATRRKFLVELDGKQPIAVQRREPYQRTLKENDGAETIATCFVRYVRLTDVSGDRPVHEWKRRDLRLVLDESGDVLGFRDLPEQSLMPNELDDLVDVMDDCVVGSVLSR